MILPPHADTIDSGQCRRACRSSRERLSIFTGRPSAIGRILGIMAIASAGLALTGCGYTGQSLYPSGIHTVAVPIWKNDTFRHQMGFHLTEAIDKNIESRTPYRLASLKHADSVLRGTIVQVQETLLSNSFETNLPQETQVTVVVDFTWKDLRTGKILSERKKFARSANTIPQIGQQLSDAEQTAMEKLARAIVAQMQKSF